jgi:hypothetical protein
MNSQAGRCNVLDSWLMKKRSAPMSIEPAAGRRVNEGNQTGE